MAEWILIEEADLKFSKEIKDSSRALWSMPDTSGGTGQPWAGLRAQTEKIKGNSIDQWTNRSLTKILLLNMFCLETTVCAASVTKT